MSEENEINKKIRETKRETEELKHQLQNLIDEGKNLICPSSSKPSIISNEKNPLESPNKVQIIKSYEQKHSNNNIPQEKTELKPDSPKKVKTYDVKQTRGYMRKQKEKLINKQKQTQEEQKIKAEIKKKKLQELNKKTRELLAKNVQAKHERSKSKDRSIYIRPDNDSIIKKAKSMDTVFNVASISQRNPDLQFPTLDSYQNTDKKIDNSRLNLNTKVKSKSHIEVNNLLEYNRTKKSLQINSESDIVLPHSPKDSVKSITNIFDHKSSQSKVTVRSPIVENEEQVKQRNSTPVLPIAALNDQKPINKYSVKIQTEKSTTRDYPEWLNEQPPQAHPYNFINTIKRKLQVATVQKPTIDIGIQSSVIQTESDSKRSDLKSFISHKCLNLDPKTIEQLSIKNLIRSKTSTKVTETESESDTSKNIPEISSESGTSLKKNAESVRKAVMSINTDRIDNMKLIATTESQNKLSVDKYTTDFDSDMDQSFISSERSRQSIISLNKSGYNAVLIPSPETIKSNKPLKTDPEKSQNNYINLQKSDENNSKKLTSTKNSLAHTETQPSSSIIKSLTISSSSLKDINTRRGSTEEQTSPESKKLITSLDTRPSINLISNTSLQNINLHRGSIEEQTSNIPPLTTPTASLSKVPKDGNCESTGKILLKNTSMKSTKENMNTNQIHLKFEAEIHLLNDFNESLKKFSALEQALETLKTNNCTTSKIIENNDARSKKDTHSQISHINYSRGSFINTSIDDLSLLNKSIDLDNNSLLSTGLDVSNLKSFNPSVSVKNDQLSNFENLHSVNFAGLSINMFEQLIKDEDARLDNLKTILKIREQALLDRTKGELAWLEIQRKQFKETGNFHEASAIKKKQRGILVNHQKEKHEMQRLKQMQKEASIERKIVLKEQRNLIRQQLSTNNMLTKMKLNTPRERRLSGPLKVLQNHTESIRSETSVSCKSSSDRDKDVMSVTSRHSFTSRQSVTSHRSVISEISELEISKKGEQHKNIKKTLLMREAALKKRKQAAEELLQWHKKLLEEEKRIVILESTASAIISKKPTDPNYTEKLDFKGNQLNQLWFNLTGSDAKKFIDNQIYPMSQIALERFCKSAREYSHKTKTIFKKTSENDASISENIPRSTETDYISDFDIESIANQNTEVDQSIDILINNFNKIQDDISNLNSSQTKQSDDDTESEAEISIIETKNREITNSNKSEKSQTSDNENESIKSKENLLVPNLDDLLKENIDKSVSKDEVIPTIASDSSLPQEDSSQISEIPISTETKESLNESQEILLMLGEPEMKINLDEEIPEIEIKDNLNASKEILSNLDEDILSQSFLKLIQISKSEEILNSSDKNIEEELIVDGSSEIDETNENQTFLNNLLASATEMNVQTIQEESDESKLALSDKSNESFVINDDNLENIELRKTDDSSVIEDISDKTTSHFSYGYLSKSEEKETSNSDIPSKEETNSFEEKEHDSLSNGGSSSEALNLEEQSSKKDKEESNVAVDVKKRVSEILADTNSFRGDKSPRLQDLYVTTYDLISPSSSPEKGTSSPKEEHKLVTSIFDNESEEILRKQLAVEEEIKAITEQQQKVQQLPLMYIREIPNKPPPPYIPPSFTAPVPVPTIIPTSEEIEEITMYAAKILHKAYLSNNLANVNISDNTLNLISKDISKDCYKFIFDLCKDIARLHYKQFEDDSPSWLKVNKKPELNLIKPLDTESLKLYMIKKLKEIFGYQKTNRRDNVIIKWSGKKRDHVDEILVKECQQEEAQWINYQKDELFVKDQITNEILDDLLKDTADVLLQIFSN